MIILFIILGLASLCGLYKFVARLFHNLKAAKRRGRKYLIYSILKIFIVLFIISIAVSLIKYAVIAVIAYLLFNIFTTNERLYGDEFYL